ncbi:MAG: orotate phosphoribosyltransferase [Rikenellaceae bacterium]
MNHSISTQVAETLLEIKAIKLCPNDHFTWASGWFSPIYCDNRKLLSYPKARKLVYEAFAQVIAAKYPEADVIAGVATGAIAHGVLAAEAMGKPFIYVRSAPKGHGLTNQIEGEYHAGMKVVVVEDLISTGGSSLSAVEALRAAGCEVLGMVAIFSYQFPLAADNFKKANCELTTLSDYTTLIEVAEKQNYIKASDVKTLKEWRKSPESWRK